MALYLGESKISINNNRIKYLLNLFSEVPILNGLVLLASEGYLLKDSNGIYLTAKEDV